MQVHSGRFLNCQADHLSQKDSHFKKPNKVHSINKTTTETPGFYHRYQHLLRYQSVGYYLPSLSLPNSHYSARFPTRNQTQSPSGTCIAEVVAISADPILFDKL